MYLKLKCTHFSSLKWVETLFQKQRIAQKQGKTSKIHIKVIIIRDFLLECFQMFPLVKVRNEGYKANI